MSDQYAELLGVDFDVDLVVDLIKRSDKADAIELLHSVIACARSGGAAEANEQAWHKVLNTFDRAAALTASQSRREP